MLFANKQNLETELKVSLLSIRERELVLYSNNCRNIAECTAILSGFALVTLTYERQTTFSGFSPISKGAYELINYLAIILNSAAMFGATTCAMLGPGLALRGADGAMDQAVEGLALEFRTTFILFFFGIVSYFCCFTVFLSMDFINGDMYDLVLHLLLIVSAPHQPNQEWRGRHVHASVCSRPAARCGLSRSRSLSRARPGHLPLLSALDLQRMQAHLQEVSPAARDDRLGRLRSRRADPGARDSGGSRAGSALRAQAVVAVAAPAVSLLRRLHE